MMAKFLKNHVWLVLIFSIALFIRLYSLGSTPLGFYEEEVTNAYVGRFILENGRDLYGNRWPILYFDKFGDYPPVLPLYLSGLSTYLFGFTQFAARFPVAVIGALTVFPLYALSMLIFRNRIVSLFCALFLAIAPWHVVLSRTTAEGIVGFAVYVWALVWILRGIGQRKETLVRRSFVLFFLTYFLYPSLRILTPLTLAPLPLLYGPKDRVRRRFMFGAVVLSFVCTGIIAVTPWGRGRFLQTSLFHSAETAEHIGIKIRNMSFDEGDDKVKLARTFHNKVIGYTREVVEQFVSYISPRHLFIEASGQPRYFNAPHVGLLPIVLSPLLVFGLLPGPPMPLLWYVIYLFFVSALPSVLTVDFVPHVHRAVFLLLPLLLLSASGFFKLVTSLPKSIPPLLPALLILVVLCFETVYFWHQYSRHEGSNQSVLRNVGDKEVVRYIIAHKGEYGGVIMPPFARLPIYYLYFSGNFDPSLIGQFKSQLQIDRLPGIEFFSDWCPTKLLDRGAVSINTLIVESGDCPGVEGYKQVYDITRKDSTRAYRLMVKE